MAKNIEYKVVQGLDYPPNKRAEAGDVVTDLPKESISWLLASGAIRVNSMPEDAPNVADISIPEPVLEVSEITDGE